MIKQHITPALWLILIIVGLPIFSETVYTPSLPDIAHTLSVRDALVEYTLTIYLFGLALGTLFWGYLSDRLGRKPCLIAGFCIFIAGCLGCYFSNSIEGLMISRLIQAVGGSVGSVLGQAICRDAFHGPALGKVYASVSGALAIFPAIGPIIGGVIDQYYGWPMIFLFLLGCGVLLNGMIAWQLPETHHAEHRQKVSIKETFSKMARDRHVIGCGLLVAAANGISFSYYAEGPFVMIEMLGLSPSQFGMTYLGIAIAQFTGGMLSRYLHHYYSSKKIMNIGLITMLVGTLVFVALVYLLTQQQMLVWGCIASMLIIMTGLLMTTSNALSIALVNYKDRIGTASSLFGFFYYTIISLFTYGMGVFHNGTVYAMPIYFCAIAGSMILINKTLLRRDGS
jgi:Bcr/CflA subfamily drug resistance transporter